MAPTRLDMCRRTGLDPAGSSSRPGLGRHRLHRASEAGLARAAAGVLNRAQKYRYRLVPPLLEALLSCIRRGSER